MKTKHHMTHEIAAAMRQYGGSFVRDLAILWVSADPENRARIETTWAEYIAKYAEFVMSKDEETAVS